MSKTSARRMRQQQRMQEERSSGRTYLVSVVGLVAVLVIALAVGLSGRDAPPSPAAGEEERTGSASALDLVADAKTVALGHVPLNETVTPTWKLTNNGKGTISIGEPHAEVVEGCCPGPFEIDSTTLAPGDSTELGFPLQMHPGMDGPHEFSIHIPVQAGGEKDLLTLTTTGHFSS